MGRAIRGTNSAPDMAGKQNIEDLVPSVPIDETNMAGKTYEIMRNGREVRKKGDSWTPEQFYNSIDNFFQYCIRKEIRPSKPLLALWLGVNNNTLNNWRKDQNRYGYKAEAVDQAMLFIEALVVENLDKHPTGSIFLLKSSHGYKDSMSVDITNTNSITTEDVNEAVKKLGLSVIDGNATIIDEPNS